MNVYLLIIALGSGAIGFVLALFEVRTIYFFIMNNQRIDRVPELTKSNKEKEVNATIRKFRSDLFSCELISRPEFSHLRTKLRVFRYSMIACSATLLIFLFILYWRTRR